MGSGVQKKVLAGLRRHEIVTLLQGEQNVGVELGVAEGVFSQRMVASGKFRSFIGIDMYGDSHDVKQYKRASKLIGLETGYKLLRMRFDEAFDLFDDESLDFIYVDGYAHGGEEGGETIFEWYRKVKVGGLIAGDDYHADWPLVVKAVDEFAQQLGEPLWVTDVTEPDNQYCRYPSWAVRKTQALAPKAPLELLEAGRAENRRVALQQDGGLLRRAARNLLPPLLYGYLKQLR